MKSAVDLFKECSAIINSTYPGSTEVERLSATIALVGLSIQAEASSAANPTK